MELSYPKIQSFTDKQKHSFELYLEGIKIPFSSISIVESEASYPIATIMLPATSGALRILGGTIVQIFGPGLIEDEKSNTKVKGKVLLFEGEVKSYSYRKQTGGRVVSLECISLLNSFENAKILPVDSLITSHVDAALNLNKVKIFNNKSIVPDYLTTADDLKAHKDQAIDWEGEMNNISLKTTLGGLATEIIKLLEKPNARLGDYFNIFHKIEAYFEVYDILYGATASAFNIRASLLAMPNPKQSKLRTAFKAKLTEVALKNLKATYKTTKLGTIDPFSLKYIFDNILQILNYKLIRPAGFPYINRFYTNTDNKGAARAIISPDLDMSPPALCNVFFPDQVEDFQFARDLKNEVTRVIAQAPVGFIENAIHKMFYPVYVTPSLALKEVGKGYQTGFTVEESYRGVVPKYVELDHTFYAALVADMQKAKNDDSDTVTADEHSEEGVLIGEAIKKGEWDTEQGQLGKIFKELTALEYFKSKMQNRGFSMSCEWSPYRMIATPALFIDKAGPSVMGVISSITTTIDANGQALSNVSFKNARLVFDNEPSSTFMTAPNTEISYVLKDFAAENFLEATSLLYDEDWYGAYNIGLDAYSYMFFGKGHKRKKFKAFADTLKKGATNWLNVTNLYQDMVARYDQSIFSIIRETETEGEDSLSISDKYSQFLKTLTEQGLSTKASKYGIQLYHAINMLRNQYADLTTLKTDQGKKTHTPKNMQSYIDAITWRPLVPKNKYLDDLGVSNLGDLVDYKDTKTLFGPAGSIADIKKHIDPSGNLLKADIALSADELEEKKIKWQELENYVMDNASEWLRYWQNLIVVAEKAKWLNRTLEWAGMAITEQTSQKNVFAQIKSSYITAVELLIQKGPNSSKGQVRLLLENLKGHVEAWAKESPLTRNAEEHLNLQNYDEAYAEGSPFHPFFTMGIRFHTEDILQTPNFSFTRKELWKIEGLESLEEQLTEVNNTQGINTTPDQKLKAAKELKALFKPYALIRRAHVLEGFNDYIIQANKDTMVTT